MLLPETQLSLRPGIVEFGWGHPDAALLPVEAMAKAAAELLGGASAADALAYGPEQGAGRLIGLLRERIGRIEGVAPPVEQLMITGGISQALDMLCAQLTRPGDVALIAAPSYHLAQRIFRDRGLRLVGVPSDGQGLHVEAAEALLAMLRKNGERVGFLYTVANFNNPSGATLTEDRRYALAALARRERLFVLEDDAYAELWYDAPPPPSLYSFAPGDCVVRLGSFAKSLAPGLRLGWMLASPDLVRRCVLSGVLDSGGGLNQFSAQLVAALIGLGLLDTHVEGLRAAYRARRDALLAGLARYLPAGCVWNPPLGGFFVWVRLPASLDAETLLPDAEAAGVSYLPGRRFYPEDGGQHALRLSFSLLPPEQLDLGARRLGDLIRQAER